MGNTSSNAKQPHSLPLDSPARSHSRRSRSTAPPTSAPVPGPASPSPRSPSVVPPPSPAPDAQNQTPTQSQSTKKERLPHRSLRTKKKSLELPDLALALTSTTSSTPSSAAAAAAMGAVNGPYRRPQASSPIAIPSSANGNDVQTQPRLPTIPTSAIAGQQLPMAEAIVQSPSNSSSRTRNGGTVNPHMRGAPLQYNSTRSFAGAYASVATGQTGQGSVQSFAARSQAHNGFVPEDVRSTIPLALRKAETDLAYDSTTVEGRDAASAAEASEAEAVAAVAAGEERRLAHVCIVWRGGGKNVCLVRAGDDNWKGRQAMDHDESIDTWTTWVLLAPGTHHIRFEVDGVVVTATDLPTAVDDNGSLANYVAVPISGLTPPTTTTVHPVLPPPSRSGNSFFADNSSSSQSIDGNSSSGYGDSSGGGRWTDKVPWQLECAAEEEEQWLAHGQSQRPPAPAPQHPHAPVLPRHLEKLIMNQRPPNVASHHSSSRHAHHGTTSAARLFGGSSGAGTGQGLGPRVPSLLPVTTASGTNLSASTSRPPGEQGVAGRGAGQNLAMTSALGNSQGTSSKTDYHHSVSVGNITGMADDGSVLPVPSHVVLHHLGTSAIRNGVLAVADTIRYRKKYITTIYYKPT